MQQTWLEGSSADGGRWPGAVGDSSMTVGLLAMRNAVAAALERPLPATPRLELRARYGMLHLVEHAAQAEKAGQRCTLRYNVQRSTWLDKRNCQVTHLQQELRLLQTHWVPGEDRSLLQLLLQHLASAAMHKSISCIP